MSEETKVSAYQVLTSTNGVDWRLVGVSSGHGQKDALRKFLAEAEVSSPSGATQYQAVPARSWKPLLVHRETKVVSTLVEARPSKPEPVGAVA